MSNGCDWWKAIVVWLHKTGSISLKLTKETDLFTLKLVEMFIEFGYQNN